MNSSIIAIEFCRFFLMYCLAAGALFKLMNFREFSHNLTDGFAIAAPLNQLVALTLIAVETCISICLLAFPEHSNTVFFACLLLFGFFGTVLLWATLQDRNIACQCFGQGDDKVSIQDVWRNIILVASCLPGIVFDTSADNSIDAQILLAVEPVVQLPTAVLALPCFLLIVYFKDAFRLLRYQSAF